LEGISEFAASKYGDLNYVELGAFPMYDEGDPFDSEPARRLLSRIRRDRNRQTVFLGYPIRLNRIRSRNGWEGFMVEPLLLFPFQESDDRHANPVMADDLPQLNFKALRSLSNTREAGLMQEAIILAEELGLGNAAGDQPELDELLARFYQIRPDWDWKEEINPNALSGGTPLSELSESGIYNRCVLIAVERSPYTRGLESELGKLQSVEESKYGETALGRCLTSDTIDAPPANQEPLLEVLPLNSEQRQAVRQALTNPLTVITGPPGTGKSQVVASILINAARLGKSVLFASKNNKAVDVVEARVNALGSRPILLRLGSNQYQANLAQYLVSLLATTTTPDDLSRYRDCEASHAKLLERSAALDSEFERLVALRNETDHLEQQVEQTRKAFGGELFNLARRLDPAGLEKETSRLQAAIRAAQRAKQPFLTRLIWPLISKARFGHLGIQVEKFRNTSQKIDLPMPAVQIDSSGVEEWGRYGELLRERTTRLQEVQKYFRKLEELTNARPMEELARQRKSLTLEIARSSDALWSAWLRLQPARMSSSERRLIGDYSTLLQLIVAANNEDRQLGREVFRRYYQLFPQIMSVLPCWAVTSLSARGKVPFEPAFFDILVVDEASQCDIASALPLLYRVKQVVIIGDPKQLQHISTLSTQQDQQLLSKYALFENFAKWSYSTTSLFGLASSLCRSDDIVMLVDHHRSHADIIGFSNDAFYEGRLRIATKYDRLRIPYPDKPAVHWIDVQGTTVRPGNGGAVNEIEARAVVKELERLERAGYRGTIGVVSPFRAQANRIKDMIYQNDRLASRLADADFISDAVHSFQGDERDVMIFSPAVSDDMPRGALWFLNNYPNLFNVAITRARASLLVVGNKNAILNCNVKYLVQFARYTERLATGSKREQVTTNIDFGPQYPSVSREERVSDWERFFYRALYERARTRGVVPIPQYSVEKYDLDFALIKGQRRLNIEIDGERYHRNWDGELCRRDQIRNQRLMELGWDVMRFWVYQVRDDLQACLARVDGWLNAGERQHTS